MLVFITFKSVPFLLVFFTQDTSAPIKLDLCCLYKIEGSLLYMITPNEETTRYNHQSCIIILLELGILYLINSFAERLNVIVAPTATFSISAL